MPSSKRKFLNHALTLYLLLSPALTVWAAQVPDAGQTSESLMRRSLTAPNKAGSTTITVERVHRPGLNTPVGQKFLVKEVIVTGQTVLALDELIPLYQSLIGKVVSIDEARDAANRITAYFRERGYLVAYAYIPAQDITEGTLEIAVLPGRYGKIEIVNIAKLTEAVFQDTIRRLQRGEIIEARKLDRAILLLNDLSGIKAKAILKPGEAVGDADLTIEILPGKMFEGSVSLDTFGNRFTGATRYGVSAYRYNINGSGDQAGLNAITTGNGLVSGSLTYQTPLGSDGGKLSVSYSDLYYELGETFASLDANGRAKTTSVNWNYPILRSRSADLYLQLGFDDKKLHDYIGNPDPATYDKHVHTVNIGVSGNNRDSWSGGGANSYSLTYSVGRLFLDSQVLRTSDASTAKSAGRYQKYSLRAVRQQVIRDDLSLFLSFTGQAADKNLDSSEKMSIGGAYGVRAYPQGEAPGDQAYIFTAEFRQLLSSQVFLPGQCQIALFFDAGSSMLNKNVWDPTSPNRRNLYAAGTGLIWSDPGQYSLRLDYARKIGSAEAKSDSDKQGRFWLQGTRYF